MKTIKYMALAALICCGQLAFGLPGSDKNTTFKTSNTAGGEITNTSKATGSFTTSSTQSTDTDKALKSITELGIILYEMARTKSTSKTADFVTKRDEIENLIKTMKTKKSEGLPLVCRQYDFICQILHAEWLVITSNNPNEQTLRKLIEGWQKNIENLSGLKRKDLNKNFSLTLDPKNQEKSKYPVSDVQYIK